MIQQSDNSSAPQNQRADFAMLQANPRTIFHEIYELEVRQLPPLHRVLLGYYDPNFTMTEEVQYSSLRYESLRWVGSNNTPARESG